MDIRSTTIVCMKWQANRSVHDGRYHSKQFTSEYVNILYNMLKHHVSTNIDFLCITDDTTYLHPNIRHLPFSTYFYSQPEQYPKLELFNKDLHKHTKYYIVYIDIDVIVLGDFISQMPTPYHLSIFAPNHRNIFGIKNISNNNTIWTKLRKCAPTKKIEKYFLSNFQPINSSIIALRSGDYQWLADNFNYEAWKYSEQKWKKNGAKGDDQLYLSSNLKQIPNWIPIGPKEHIYKTNNKRIQSKLFPNDAKLLVLSGKNNRPWQLINYPEFTWLKEYLNKYKH